MKTKEEILKAKTAKEVLLWIQSVPDELIDVEICQYFNDLAKKEFVHKIGPDFNPDMHYDFGCRRKEEK